MIAWLTSLPHKLRALFGSRRSSTSAADIDPELREVFLGELAEVTRKLQSDLTRWRLRPTDPTLLKSIKRSFHTIKGSAPLVNATELGELGRQVEQLMYQCAERPGAITPEMVRIVEQAVAVLPAFAVAIREGRAPPQARDIGIRIHRLLA